MRMKGRSASIAAFLSALAAFSIAAAAGAQQTAQSDTVRVTIISSDLLDMRNVDDERLDTRASSGKANYVGMSFTVDLGSEQNVIGVSQDHGRWPTQFPGAYKVEVAASLTGPWMLAWEGPGQRGDSRVKFEAIRARYIRVTATKTNSVYREPWSIAELRAGIDPGQTARRIPAEPGRPPAEKETPPPARLALRDTEHAFDKNPDTRATSGRADYEGMFLAFDLGGEYEFSRIAQVHGRWSEEYPAEYKIEVSRERDESKFREVWRGKGELGRSVARFNPVVTRYVRVTALRSRNRTQWWSVAELRTNRDEDVIVDDERSNRPIRGITTRGLSNVDALTDDNNKTRATTGTSNYEGSWVQVDLGGSYSVFRVVQVHEPDINDYPGRYRIEVSLDGRRWQGVFEGAGERSRSGARFTPVRARFIRITALSNHDTQHSWSIYQLKVMG
jgi:F5/8 type C domain-containing protein